ncbi:hypothetical protein IDH44_07735 [Paenibacillus sp. IB182496]|uniref:Uncharacterized protein n=1 Tax=Paenibacillus sabuli TaxID=2772509 RepID=A0A927BTD7_9BACL|nr:hypothetical protein [Paenibacillus sabuli]MBD2845078.1 hypothetical protein [Paenibacillus sabuli]
MTLTRKIEVLREYEKDCYRICYFLLECERRAEDAAKDALYQLCCDASFFVQPPAAQKKRVRRTAVEHALALGDFVATAQA